LYSTTLTDLDRNIVSIRYNILNLPDTIQFRYGNQIINRYSADGRKLGTEYFTRVTNLAVPLITGQVINQTYTINTINQNGTAYIDNKEYNTLKGNPALTTLQRVYNAEGYAQNITATTPNYYYYRQDHLGNNREVWLANTKKTVQRTQYYPSGLPWASIASDSTGLQERKYNGKEFVEMHGYDTYDYGARGYYAAMGRFTSVDPLAENYYETSPYSYCDGNPVNNIDPDGRDYWSTSDPATIERFLNSLKQVGGSRLPSESFDYGEWGHATDAQFTCGLTYNDDNQTFYSSYGTVENGQSVIHGIKIKAASFGDGNASVQTEKGKWYDKSSGAIKQENVEFALIVGGSKVGLSAFSWIWNNIINPPAPSTTLTFDANASRLVNQRQTEKMGRSKENMPGNNQMQNKQIDNLARVYNLSVGQRSELHRLIGGEGYGYKEIEQLIKDYFNK